MSDILAMLRRLVPALHPSASSRFFFETNKLLACYRLSLLRGERVPCGKSDGFFHHQKGGGRLV